MCFIVTTPAVVYGSSNEGGVAKINCIETVGKVAILGSADNYYGQIMRVNECHVVCRQWVREYSCELLAYLAAIGIRARLRQTGEKSICISHCILAMENSVRAAKPEGGRPPVIRKVNSPVQSGTYGKAALSVSGCARFRQNSVDKYPGPLILNKVFASSLEGTIGSSSSIRRGSGRCGSKSGLFPDFCQRIAHRLGLFPRINRVDNHHGERESFKPSLWVLEKMSPLMTAVSVPKALSVIKGGLLLSGGVGCMLLCLFCIRCVVPEQTTIILTVAAGGVGVAMFFCAQWLLRGFLDLIT